MQPEITQDKNKSVFAFQSLIIRSINATFKKVNYEQKIKKVSIPYNQVY